jgi:5'-phosphate synthase pdxT subunit
MGEVGVLGLQGDFAAHGKALDHAGARWRVVKKPGQLAQLSGLIIPGGESTTLIRLMDFWGFWEPLQEYAATGGALFGTCAGMILLAREVVNPAQRSLGLIDIRVERNSYGRQLDSFEGAGTFSPNGVEQSLEMIFIRAPRILSLGPGVEPLGTCRGDCVVARQGRVLVASFHPELTDDPSLHRYFLEMAAA